MVAFRDQKIKSFRRRTSARPGNPGCTGVPAAPRSAPTTTNCPANPSRSGLSDGHGASRSTLSSRGFDTAKPARHFRMSGGLTGR